MANHAPTNHLSKMIYCFPASHKWLIQFTAFAKTANVFLMALDLISLIKSPANALLQKEKKIPKDTLRHRVTDENNFSEKHDIFDPNKYSST
ncbi:hypothetical protein CEXT_543621 [Caerostris extrusa]|uniref:Uncharacterized protein n=1 Tax=Caerostris extrusa TaxID=172846 RepID=A0AAV4QYV8_CAEEX|nr:hypothetical protein CEXT_543621 [Caerostris extrusa]